MKHLLTLFFYLAVHAVYPQMVVFDPAVVSTLVINHEAQQGVLKEIRNKEGEIAAAQKTIALQMTAIKDLEQRMYNSLKNVTAIVNDAKDIVYAAQIAKDIGEYQSKMMQLALEDPELMAVAVKTELALINRSADLMWYIYKVAIIPGDVNLLDNKQRLDIIKHVVNELRIMRGIAYGIYRRMKVANQAAVLKMLNPAMKYTNNGAAIVEELLNDLKKK